MISADASAYTQVTGMAEWALRCQERAIAAYMHEHLAITNVNMFAFVIAECLRIYAAMVCSRHLSTYSVIPVT